MRQTSGPRADERLDKQKRRRDQKPMYFLGQDNVLSKEEVHPHQTEQDKPNDGEHTNVTPILAAHCRWFHATLTPP